MKENFWRSMMLPARIMHEWWSDWNRAYQKVMKEIREEAEDVRGNR